MWAIAHLLRKFRHDSFPRNPANSKTQNTSLSIAVITSYRIGPHRSTSEQFDLIGSERNTSKWPHRTHRNSFALQKRPRFDHTNTCDITNPRGGHLKKLANLHSWSYPTKTHKAGNLSLGAQFRTEHLNLNCPIAVQVRCGPIRCSVVRRGPIWFGADRAVISRNSLSPGRGNYIL